MFEIDLLIEEIIEDVWLAIFVFMQLIHVCGKRKGFTTRVLGILPVYLFVSGVQYLLYYFYPLYGADSWLESIFRFLLSWEWLVVLVALIAYVRICFQCNWNMLLFSVLAGFCVQELMFGIWTLIIVLEPSLDTPWIHIPISSVVGVCLTVGLYYFLASKITPLNLKTLEKRSLMALLQLYILSAVLVHCSTTSVIFLNVFFDDIQSVVGTQNFISRLDVGGVRISSIYANLAGNLLILFALRNMLYFSEKEMEKEMLAQIREQDRKQYTRFRDNVDYINTKSHDLKHYLSLLQRDKKLPERELHQVSESIRHLDSETDSGNETLDLILTDRRLACEGKGIELIFQTDGTRLEQLDVIDTYTVFCNILDNAVEYVKELPEAERQIRLGIRTIHGMVFIHQENPLDGTLDMKDGLPVTTQEDSIHHGFGLKSVQSTVKKRGGELVIRAESGRFELDICFSQGIAQE